MRSTTLTLATAMVVVAGLSGRLAAQEELVEPDSPEVRALMQEATLHMAEDRWSEAVEAWSRLIALSPAHVVAHLNRAMSHFRAGNCEERASDARRVLEIMGGASTESQDLERLVYRAQAHAHLMGLDQAIRLLETAQRDSPDSRPVGIILNQMRRRATGASEWRCPRP